LIGNNKVMVNVTIKS